MIRGYEPVANSSYHFDLHIHSALSPTADNDMSPNHIVSLALVLGLDAIAVADCNCAANLPAVASLAGDAGMAFVPGIELVARDGERMLAYMGSVEAAVDFGECLYDALPSVPPDGGARQLVMNEMDQVTGERGKLLSSALPYGADECRQLAEDYGAVLLSLREEGTVEHRLLSSGARSLDAIGDPARLLRLSTLDVDAILALLADSAALNATQEGLN